MSLYVGLDHLFRSRVMLTSIMTIENSILFSMFIQKADNIKQTFVAMLRPE